MTIYDLLFILLLLWTIVMLVVAAVSLFRGRKARGLTVLRWAGAVAAVYMATVYIATAFSKELVLSPGEPWCNDDWCVALDSVQRTANGAAAIYDLKVRIFSRAKGRTQREMGATDVYLVDADWKRYDPVPHASQPPLNALLRPGESVITPRRFEVPANVHVTGMMVGRAGPAICVIIGECGAFHKAPLFLIDKLATELR